MKKPIIMISGEKHSGKTRLMYALCSLLDLDGYSIGGMIQVPTLPHETKTSYALSDQLTGNSKVVLDENFHNSDKKIGKFYIDEEAFNWANSQIIKAFESSDYLIFDEVGQLEIQKGGFYPSLLHALSEYKGTIMMIVRTPYIEHVYKMFDIHEDSVLPLCSSLSSDEAYREVLGNE